MSKKTKIIITIIFSLFLINTSFITIDYNRTKSNKLPIFAIPILRYKDGGSVEYWGLGYKVLKCNTLSGDKSIHMGFYNLDIDKKCNNNPINTKGEKQFRGKIIEIYPDGSLIVEPNEDEEIRRSSDKIIVDTHSDKVYEINSKVIVTYTGEVMESYPAQINTISVQIYD